MGTLEAIWSKRATGGPMDSRTEATLDEGAGMRDDANYGRTRPITVIARDAWDRAAAEAPGATPDMRRANLMVRGVDLEDSRGKILRIGDAAIRIRGETRPCDQMDAQCPGLRAALDPEWRGGVHGPVVRGGVVRVGDPVSIEPDPARPEG